MDEEKKKWVELTRKLVTRVYVKELKRRGWEATERENDIHCLKREFVIKGRRYFANVEVTASDEDPDLVYYLLLLGMEKERTKIPALQFRISESDGSVAALADEVTERTKTFYLKRTEVHRQHVKNAQEVLSGYEEVLGKL